MPWWAIKLGSRRKDRYPMLGGFDVCQGGGLRDGLGWDGMMLMLSI